jgi:hypothetical protein
MVGSAFLSHVGEQSLPDALLRIAPRLRAGDPSRMLHPLELKKNLVAGRLQGANGQPFGSKIW